MRHHTQVGQAINRQEERSGEEKRGYGPEASGGEEERMSVTLHFGVTSASDFGARGGGGGVGARQLQQGGSRAHVSPSVLVIVIVLSVVFICSGVLHILARCLGRRRARTPAGDFTSPSNSIRGQLQHLFSLHDSGVEQVFIDALPVFLYGSIRGLKDSADCAVCLTEFANEDRLRLLPKCKHAFHLDCIDTWLLSNSTCPLCRRNLLLDTDSSSTTITTNPDSNPCNVANTDRHGSFRSSLRGSFRFLADAVLPPPPPPSILPPAEVEEILPTPPMTPGPTVCVTKPDGSEKVMRVELGKVNTSDSDRRISREVVGSSARPRCYSMGSYEYVVDFSTLIGTPVLIDQSKPTHRSTLSDGTPELASASHTPRQEDMFWAKRVLETPQNLSRVREMMTPSPGWAQLDPPDMGQQSGNMKIRGDEEEDDGAEKIQGDVDDSRSTMMISGDGCGLDGDERVQEEGAGKLSPSLSLRLFSVEDKIDACGSERGSVEEMAVDVRKDKAWEVSVDVTVPGSTSEAGSAGRSASSSRKSSPLNWLRGRGRRLVYSATSPFSAEVRVQSPDQSKVITSQEQGSHVVVTTSPAAADS